MPFDGVTVSQTASDLIRARQLLIERGWRRERGDLGGPHCPVTALMEAQGREHFGGVLQMGFIALTPRFRKAYRALKTALPKSERKKPLAVPVWNVAQDSADPALALFDRAIGAAILDPAP